MHIALAYERARKIWTPDGQQMGIIKVEVKVGAGYMVGFDTPRTHRTERKDP